MFIRLIFSALALVGALAVVLALLQVIGTGHG